MANKDQLKKMEQEKLGDKAEEARAKATLANLA